MLRVQIREPTSVMFRPRGRGFSRFPRPPPPPPSYFCYEGLRRHWERVRPVDSRSAIHQTIDSLTVATYNTLSDEQSRLNSSLYRHLPGYILSWPHRSRLLMQEMVYFNADILCLQEIDEAHYYDFFRRRLSDYGYLGWYKRRTGDKPDGCAIFWKCNLLGRALIRPVEFKVYEVPVLDRDNVGLIVILKLRQSSQSSFPLAICVATTHLLFNAKRGDVKLAQLILLLAEIGQACQQFKHENPRYHLFLLLCGDLNLYPFCPLYSFITTGEICYEGMNRSILSGQVQSGRGPVSSQYILKSPLLPNWLNINQDCCYDHSTSQKREAESSRDSASNEEGSSSANLRHRFHLCSAYQHWTSTGYRELTTCLLNGSQNTVDYIFYTSAPLSIEPTDTGAGPHPCMDLTDRRTLITGDCLQMVGALPNSIMPSDHQALQARFEFSIPRRQDRTASKCSKTSVSPKHSRSHKRRH